MASWLSWLTDAETAPAPATGDGRVEGNQGHAAPAPERQPAAAGGTREGEEGRKGQERNEALLILDDHVVCPRLLVSAGVFGTLSAAHRWLQKRQKSGEVKFYTRYRIAERGRIGKPDYWFHSADVGFKKDNGRHEVYLTEFL